MFNIGFYGMLAIYLVVIGLALGIFLYGKSGGDSFFDRAYRLFCQHLPNLLKAVLRKIPGVGERGPR